MHGSKSSCSLPLCSGYMLGIRQLFAQQPPKIFRLLYYGSARADEEGFVAAGIKGQ
ncbi:hypothetical protein BDW71DRAFT_176537 [Aspergillus fruticulosus]